MGDIVELQKKVLEFRDARNWAQFHNGKDLAACLSVEASEVLELFLWKGAQDVDRARLQDEIADTLCSILLLAHEYKIDLVDAVSEKLTKNAEKYPIEKSWGNNKKYSEY